MDTGFKITVIWSDNDVIKIRVSAWNGLFGGAADVYVGVDQLGETAAQLEGFPKTPSDVRKVILGAFGPESAGGGVSIRFYCVDGSGHSYVDSRIESDYDSARKSQSAVLSLPIEAAAVDSFVEELRCLNAERKGAAHLKGRI
jgi:hypothetical protein